MQKKLRLLFIFISLIFICNGCSVVYKATITEENIDERLTLTETSLKAYQNAFSYSTGSMDNFEKNRTYLDKYSRYKVNEYIDKFYINKDNFDRDNYLSGWSTKNELYEYSFGGGKKELSLKNNSFLNNVIKDSIIINDNSIILHIDNIPNGLLDEIDDVTVTIYTELTVTSNNADTVENNTYTWNLDKNNYLNKKISLYIERPQAEKNPEDDKKNNNTSNKKDNTAFHIIFIIGLYSVIIIAVVNFFNKKKKLF